MNKSLTILIILLVALVAVYFLVMQSEKSDLQVNQIENLVGLDSGMVNEMTITTADSSVVFKKQGGEWMVQHYGQLRAAEPGVVSQIAQLASGLTVGEVVSSNPEKQSLYQVDETSGRLITFLRDGNELGSVIVGKSGTDFQSSYVRMPESEDVYLSTTNLTRLVQRPVDQFRDKAVVQLDPSRITRIEVTSPNYDYAAVPGDSLWQLTDNSGEPSAIQQQQMQSWLSQVAALRVNSFLSPDSSAAVDFSNPTAEVTISITGDEPVTIQFLSTGEDAADYLVKTSQSDEVYSVRNWVYNNLIKDPETLRIKEAS